MNDNRKMLESIRNDLNEMYNGDAYTCPNCGATCEYTEAENDDGEIIHKTSCGCVCDDEPEPAYLLDYFNDVLDINYILNSDRELIGVKLLLTCGGPNIWLNTDTCKLSLHWWTEYDEIYIDRDVCDAITEVFKDVFYC